jgi:hypothetical protein
LGKGRLKNPDGDHNSSVILAEARIRRAKHPCGVISPSTRTVVVGRLVAPVVEAGAKVLVNRTTVPPCGPGWRRGLREPLEIVSQTTQSGKEAAGEPHCRAISGVNRITAIFGLGGGDGRMGAGGTGRHHAAVAAVKTVIGQV